MPRARVLVVEGDRKLARVIARGLREEGYLPDIANSGDEALRMARTSGYELILIDEILPGADGFEICRRLRFLGISSAVLILTVWATPDNRVNVEKAGADGHLAKPFSFDDLLAGLHALMDRPAAPAAPAAIPPSA